MDYATSTSPIIVSTPKLSARPRFSGRAVKLQSLNCLRRLRWRFLSPSPPPVKRPVGYPEAERYSISLKLGACELKITASEINLNNGMVKVTAAGASLVNDAFKIGA